MSIFNLIGRGKLELLKQVCILVHLQGESIDLDLVLAPHQGQMSCRRTQSGRTGADVKSPLCGPHITPLASQQSGAGKKTKGIVDSPSSSSAGFVIAVAITGLAAEVTVTSTGSALNSRKLGKQSGNLGKHSEMACMDDTDVI